ncbi:MAG: hypothetical protein LAN63_02370 [Acidobacteriia bacterium]|nr:hypothetical protein [Terriglobia bacterium]
MRFPTIRNQAMVVPDYAWRFLPPSVASALRFWLFHPLAATEKAIRHLTLLVSRKVHATLLKAAGLPDPHGRHS